MHIKAIILLVAIYLQTHVILISDVECINVYVYMHVVENQRSKVPEEMILLVQSMTHCGRKKEMNDPYGTNLPLHAHTHARIYHTVYRDVRARERDGMCV